MKLNYLVAVTGGIGSGKSTVCNYFKRLGFKVFDADVIAKTVMKDKEIILQIAKELNLPLNSAGGLDSQNLASVVFSDKKKLQRLNQIVHPATIKALQQALQKEQGIVFAEVSLLFESGAQNFFDHVLVVMRDKKKRISAVMQRSNLTQNEVEQRILSQYNYDENIPEIAHTYIYNNSNLEELNITLSKVLGEIKNKAQQKI